MYNTVQIQVLNYHFSVFEHVGCFDHVGSFVRGCLNGLLEVVTVNEVNVVIVEAERSNKQTLEVEYVAHILQQRRKLPVKTEVIFKCRL